MSSLEIGWAQLNSSGPRESISILLQYLLMKLYKTFPNLALPDQFGIPFTHPIPAGGHLTPAPNPNNFK